jgi:hypothetical protein
VLISVLCSRCYGKLPMLRAVVMTGTPTRLSEL